MLQQITAKPSERNERVRRPADFLVAILVVGGFVAILFLAHALPRGTRELTGDVAGWIAHHIPRPLAYVFGSVVDVAAFALVIVASQALARNGRRDGLNAVTSAVLGVAGAFACVLEWRPRSGGIAIAMLGGSPAGTFVITAGLFAFLTGSDLVRRPPWTKPCVLVATAFVVGALALNDLTFVATVAVPLMGWGSGLVVRWALGAESVRPTADSLSSWMRLQGVDVISLEPIPGKVDFEGRRSDDRSIAISLANRDTRGSGIARRLWHSVRLGKTVTGAEALSSRSQLERQALASFLAASADVVASRVILFAECPPETLVLAMVGPEGDSLSEKTSPNELAGVFASLASLHRAGVAHRDLRPDRVIVNGEGPGFVSLLRAQTGAGEIVRRLDVAQLLTSAARLLGAPAAVHALRAGYEPEDEAAIVSILQPIALASWGWSAMRDASDCLTEVRHELVGSGEDAVPQRLERFRWRTVISTVALTVAAFVLVGQLSRVNLLGALKTMNPGWFLLAIAGSALTYLGAALNLAAFVPKRLSVIRGFFVQISSAFVGVAMPPTVGHVAVNGRYLHRQGVDDGSIAAAITASQIVNVVTTIPMLVVIGVLTGSGVSRFKIVPGANVLIGVAVMVGVIGLFIAVPRTRSLMTEYARPKLRSAVPRLLDAVSQPLRLAVGVGGNLLLTLGYVGALLASLYAFGAHPPILPTAAVFLAGNAVGSIAPTPGGLGAVEAVMSAGLTAIGIPAHEAVPAVLIFRTATFWIPIPAGWLTFLYLQRSGTL